MHKVQDGEAGWRGVGEKLALDKDSSFSEIKIGQKLQTKLSKTENFPRSKKKGNVTCEGHVEWFIFVQK